MKLFPSLLIVSMPGDSDNLAYRVGTNWDSSRVWTLVPNCYRIWLLPIAAMLVLVICAPSSHADQQTSDRLIELAAGLDDASHSYVETQDWSGLVRQLDALIKQRPAHQCELLLELRGLAKMEMNDFYGAINDLTQVIELNPYSATAYQARRQCFLKTGDVVKASGDKARLLDLRGEVETTIPSEAQGKFITYVYMAVALAFVGGLLAYMRGRRKPQ